jgi:hypothetical protein
MCAKVGEHTVCDLYILPLLRYERHISACQYRTFDILVYIQAASLYLMLSFLLLTECNGLTNKCLYVRQKRHFNQIKCQTAIEAAMLDMVLRDRNNSETNLEARSSLSSCSMTTLATDMN